MSEIENSEREEAFRVKGTFLGQPIDVTLGPVDSECFAEPEKPVEDLTDEAQDAGVATTEGTSGCETVEETVPADPAPEVKETSDEAPNPAGNAEQL